MASRVFAAILPGAEGFATRPFRASIVETGLLMSRPAAAGALAEGKAPRVAKLANRQLPDRLMEAHPPCLDSTVIHAIEAQSVVDSGLTHLERPDPCNPCRRVRARRVVVMEDHEGIFRRSVTSYSPSQSAAAAAAAAAASATAEPGSGPLPHSRPLTSPARATSAPRAGSSRLRSSGQSMARQQARPPGQSGPRWQAERPPRSSDRWRGASPRRFFTDAVKVANWQPLASPVRPGLFAAEKCTINRQVEPMESWSARLDEVESGMPLRRAMWTAPGPMGRLPPAERKALIVERLKQAHRGTISQSLPSELRQSGSAGSVVGFGVANSNGGSVCEPEWDPVGFGLSESRARGQHLQHNGASDADGAFDEELWARFGVDSCRTAGSSGSDPRADTGQLAAVSDALSALRRAGSVGLQSPRRQAKPPAPKHSISRKY